MGKKTLSVEKQYFKTIDKIEEILRHYGQRKKLLKMLGKFITTKTQMFTMLQITNIKH